jgi:PAS domain S-box-containing protein
MTEHSPDKTCPFQTEDGGGTHTHQGGAGGGHIVTEAFLESIIENSPYALWVSDHRGTLIRMNQACRDLFHVTDEDLVGKYNVFEDNIVEDQGMMPLVRRVFEKGERVHFTLRYDSSTLRSVTLHETARVVLEVTISPVLDVSGKVVNTIIQHLDITEHVEREETLRKHAQETEWLMKSMANAFCMWETVIGEDGRLLDIRFVYFNDAYARVSGLNLDEARGRTVREIWPGTEESWFETYGEVARTGRPRVFEMYHAPTSGLYACVAYRPWEASPNICVVFEDITKRKKTEEALRGSEERLKRLLQNSNDIITVLDAKGVQLSVNGPVEDILGYSPADLIGTNAFDFIHPEDLDMSREIFTETVAGTGAMRRLECRFRHKNGTWKHVEVVGTNCLDDPVIHGVIVNVRDVSERKKGEEERNALEEQLQQAMKMEAVGRLAGGVAHDFNNLLTVIGGNVELMKMGLHSSDPLVDSLDTVQKAAESAAALTRQLLAFSRRQIIEPRVLNLNDLVENLMKMLPRLIGEDVTLKAFLAGNLEPVKVDPGQFEQVLINLAVNARDAMPEGGRLTIETANIDLNEEYCALHSHAEPGRFVQLAITDTGCGMTREVKQHLFEPFFTTKTRGRGTGLGLATIFGTVKQAGGSIEVYSEPGQGTSFKIYLPVVEEAAGQFVREIPEVQMPGGNETILVVEDEASVRMLAVTMLERLGYRVLAASNGDEAFRVAEKHGQVIHLLMTDVVMPVMNGRELAERLVGIRPGIKVLFTSGYTENIVVHHGIVEENLNFIGKPYTMQNLARKVREVLGT